MECRSTADLLDIFCRLCFRDTEDVINRDNADQDA